MNIFHSSGFILCFSREEIAIFLICKTLKSCFIPLFFRCHFSRYRTQKSESKRNFSGNNIFIKYPFGIWVVIMKNWPHERTIEVNFASMFHKASKHIIYIWLCCSATIITANIWWRKQFANRWIFSWQKRNCLLLVVNFYAICKHILPHDFSLAFRTF